MREGEGKERGRGEGERERGRREGERGRTGACQSVFAAVREYRDTDLNVPAERSELLLLLNDSMEETQTKDQLPPRHSQHCNSKEEDSDTDSTNLHTVMCITICRGPDYLVIIMHLTMIFNE